MSKVVAIMSMSLDGYVADPNGGVAEVFDWYFTSGDVEFHTGGSDPMTFKVSAPSAEHLRSLTSGLGAVLTGRRTFDVAQGWAEITPGDRIRPDPPHPRRMAATQLDCPLRDRRHRERREPSQGRRRREVRWGPRRRHHPALPECWPPRRNPRRHRGRSSWLRSSALRPPRRTPAVLGNPTVIHGRRSYTPALPGAQAESQRLPALSSCSRTRSRWTVRACRWHSGDWRSA